MKVQLIVLIGSNQVGADLSHVFCTSDSATVIKSYSPDLIVHPVLDDEKKATHYITEMLPRLHSIIIGPGLGRDHHAGNLMKHLIPQIRKHEIPIILDADALHFVTFDEHVRQTIVGYKRAILTPNMAELNRLWEVLHDAGHHVDSIHRVQMVVNKLDVTILSKGPEDIIASLEHPLHPYVVKEPGSNRRCGGQGDILAGALGTFAAWAHRSNLPASRLSLSSIACIASSLLVRRASGMTFSSLGRSMTTADMLPHLGRAFDSLFVRC